MARFIEDDIIFPVHGQEYVLKGSQLLDFDNSGKASDFPAVVTHRCNQSWSSIDLSEYKVYKASESTPKLATDASTQTDDRRRKKKPAKEEEEEEEEETSGNEITELSREEIISPPQSESSPQTLETLLKADRRLILRPEEDEESNRTVESLSSGKMRASAVLMRMISCGAMSFKECWPTLMTGHTMCTIERGTGNYRLERAEKELRSFGRVKLEENGEI